MVIPLRRSSAGVAIKLAVMGPLHLLRLNLLSGPMSRSRHSVAYKSTCIVDAIWGKKG